MSWRRPQPDRARDRDRDPWGGDGHVGGGSADWPDPIAGGRFGRRPGDRRPERLIGPGMPGAPPSSGPRRAGPLTGVVLGVVLGAASSTVTTALAVGVAGKNADRYFESIEFTIRVVLLLAAPCMGAILAALFVAVVAPGRLVLAPWAVGLGVMVGPILALRLDRVLQLGVRTTVVFGVLLVCWAIVGGVLAAAAASRTASRSPSDHDRLPPYGGL